MSRAIGNKTYIERRSWRSIPVVPKLKWRPVAAIRSVGPEGKKEKRYMLQIYVAEPMEGQKVTNQTSSIKLGTG